MSDDPRVEELLQELLDSSSTPEEVCRACPELLPQVRAGWQRLRALEAEVGALFPASTPGDGATPAPTSAELPRIHGYEVQEVLGHGGMGVVYKAWHRRLNRTVALKMLLAGPYTRPEELERFLREAEAAAGLRHANIVQVHEIGDVDGRPYFTMEFVEGGNLAQKLAGTPLPAGQAAALLATLADAVQIAHQSGIVHRDLKPANILLTADGLPKITDFGLARRLEDGGGLTLTGSPVGTPSYMAPEQAQGNKDAIGPGTDVYALGAILYECLTGRPPFRADSATATMQQVVADEPVSPARLNRRIPRDLATICLKCLYKEPSRRYATAAALAEDLQRFLRGDPIAARPPGRWERLVRWLRRHPAQAALLATTVLVVLAAVGGGGWLIGQRTQTVRAVEADVREVVRLQQQSALPEARAALQRAQIRLGDDGPDSARSLVDQARHDQQLLERLEAIRMDRSTFVEGRQDHPADVRLNNAQADREYQKAFRDAALGEAPGDPDGAAARIKASPLRVPLVAALDDWAACSPDTDRRSWIVRVARGADPDAWRELVRDPTAWEDRVALEELARTAPVAEQQPPLLLALGERLQLAGGDGIGLLRRVQEQYPDDFWANFTLANALYGLARQDKADAADAAASYQRALVLRPGAVAAHNNLGLALYIRYWLDDNATGWGGPGAISVYQRALRCDAACAPVHNNLGLALKGAGLNGTAMSAYREALRINPRLAAAYSNLGDLQAAYGEINDAIDRLQQALRIDPDFALAHYYLGVALLAKGRRDEVDADYPQDAKPLEPFRQTALPEVIVYYWKARNLEPQWVAARNGLQISPQDSARLDEAIDHYRQAIRLEPWRAVHHAALGQALLARWQFADAETATRHGLERLLPREKELRGRLECQHERCRHLLALEDRLPAIVRGMDKPADDEGLEAAELCFVKQHYATAARLFAEALAAAPDLTQDPRAGHRFNAARAAALAGCGRGDDAAGLGEPGRRNWRKQARECLQLDLAAWAKKLDTGTAADRIQARKTLSQWQQDPDLAGLRDAAALDKLPPAECQECRALWNDVDARLERARSPK